MSVCVAMIPKSGEEMWFPYMRPPSDTPSASLNFPFQTGPAFHEEALDRREQGRVQSE